MKTRRSARVSVSSKTKNVSRTESNVVVTNRTRSKSKANSSTNSKVEAANSKGESKNKIEKNTANSDDKKLQLEDILEETLKKLCLGLSANDNFDFSGYEHEINFIDHVLKNTLENNDSNTVLICGPRGVGKSTLIDYCLNR
ncbi:hypothetical protein B4U80_13359 [Leptotrombidium deliense]|uniref:Origin recognition complex subunit 4 n=1 Tax=Leptotrombidium deliense TaxID=299467 RepID=A0A443S7K8_9ACAR|nr:hypothetical protein B4U80_13359 [Leptotrombidium deliense]